MPSIAFLASSGFSNVTKPNPRDLWVSLSMMTVQTLMAPYFEKASVSESLPVSYFRFPTYSFPSSDMMLRDLTNRSPKESDRRLVYLWGFTRCRSLMSRLPEQTHQSKAPFLHLQHPECVNHPGPYFSTT
ncbi:hypothetical protein EYF80_047544 [Liparis tanakae]|uniref:Uncharacterized protein n=1 Tax=Liparis tanakae TaxID=230148 RepID=A0A4Z2FPM8_9TELE|nr:hypothetical protein EYF80_047544 [Liparis tanakae]